jgi:hypothetical protein
VTLQGFRLELGKADPSLHSCKTVRRTPIVTDDGKVVILRCKQQPVV